MKLKLFIIFSLACSLFITNSCKDEVQSREKRSYLNRGNQIEYNKKIDLGKIEYNNTSSKLELPRKTYYSSLNALKDDIISQVRENFPDFMNLRSYHLNFCIKTDNDPFRQFRELKEDDLLNNLNISNELKYLKIRLTPTEEGKKAGFIGSKEFMIIFDYYKTQTKNSFYYKIDLGKIEYNNTTHRLYLNKIYYLSLNEVKNDIISQVRENFPDFMNLRSYHLNFCIKTDNDPFRQFRELKEDDLLNNLNISNELKYLKIRLTPTEEGKKAGFIGSKEFMVVFKIGNDIDPNLFFIGGGIIIGINAINYLLGS